MALTDGLIASYDLSDLTDASGNGNTLTNTNGVTFSTGAIGNGADFGNTNGRRLNRSDTLGITNTGSYSIVGVFKFNSELSVDEDIWSMCFNGTSGAINRGVYEHNGGSRRLRFYRAGTTTAFLDIAGNFGDNVFRQFAFTYNGGTGALSFQINNGTPVTGNSTGTANQSVATGIDLGDTRASGYSLGMNGMLDCVRFYNRVLTSTEITQLWNNGAFMSHAQLAAYGKSGMLNFF